MQYYFIYNLLYILINVKSQQLCESPYEKINLIFKKTLNETFLNVYNEIITAANIYKSHIIVDSPFCIEPTRQYYKIISKEIIINYLEQKTYNKYKLLTKYEYLQKIKTGYNLDHLYTIEYDDKEKCPSNIFDGYIIWSYYSQDNKIPYYNIPMNKFRKYVKYYLNRIKDTFPDSIFNITFDVPIHEYDNIYSTNCCPKYNISF